MVFLRLMVSTNLPPRLPSPCVGFPGFGCGSRSVWNLQTGDYSIIFLKTRSERLNSYNNILFLKSFIITKTDDQEKDVPAFTVSKSFTSCGRKIDPLLRLFTELQMPSLFSVTRILTSFQRKLSKLPSTA